jgi:NAD(P)-dependent dehydrogenase (short-subunit alcohol dehydrogenase family)
MMIVNNAGMVYIKKLMDTSEEEWDKTIEINLKGAFLLFKAVLSSINMELTHTPYVVIPV